MSNEERNIILWSKLPEKEVQCKPYQLRVLQFDPAEISTWGHFNPNRRSQLVGIGHIFPSNGNVCGCGCGQILTGRRTRWATEECQRYAVAVRFILAGNQETIQGYMRIYYGWKCFKCGCKDKGHEMGANGTVAWIKIDHIIPVKLGGGACWLSNYQLLCHDCHVGKTSKDFNWKTSMPKLF
jgi:5-methylcytosine-specific restriction endonuclease McrA